MRPHVLAVALIATLPALAVAGAADVGRLAWMVGTWSQSQGDTVVRETWTADGPGRLSGLGETRRPGRPALTERMTITSEAAGVTFTAILPGQPPTPFVLKPGPDGEAVFENTAHDFPQRVIYRRCGADLCARIEGVLKGKPESEAWRYTRQK